MSHPWQCFMTQYNYETPKATRTGNFYSGFSEVSSLNEEVKCYEKWSRCFFVCENKAVSSCSNSPTRSHSDVGIKQWNWWVWDEVRQKQVNQAQMKAKHEGAAPGSEASMAWAPTETAVKSICGNLDRIRPFLPEDTQEPTAHTVWKFFFFLLV